MSKSDVIFSIIIPAYNAEGYICRALDSAFAQSVPEEIFEVILVDDCSKDSTREVVAQYGRRRNFRSLVTERNSGPGVARNVGLGVARGEWILFLDSDDRLFPTALYELYRHIDERNDGLACVDVVGFNWTYQKSDEEAGCSQVGLRKDHVYLSVGRDELIKRYLRLQMDGAVLFMAVRRSLLGRYRISFAEGYHEDVDFLFFVYWYARSISFVDRVLYEKLQRPGSIVNTVSGSHIVGFMRAWKEIGLFLNRQSGDAGGNHKSDFRIGLVAVIATRVREICKFSEPASLPGLFRVLYDQCQEFFSLFSTSIDPCLETKYAKIARCFVDGMNEVRFPETERAQRILESVRGILSKTWSCVDLHHSVFLAPDQIRTCCKRFFLDGRMKGDVVLLDFKGKPEADVSSDQILLAKRNLHDAINKGDVTDCQGCPFLEFREWGGLDELSIRYLSLEYQSVCNLRCVYCSDTYYGGRKAHYDVRSLVGELIGKGQLEDCHTVVFGGGEPVIDSDFGSLIELLVAGVQKAAYRVLTNSVKFSGKLACLLKDGQASIVTSVDAGSVGTFSIVRGSDKLHLVMSHLKKYAALRPSAVTVKYIFNSYNTTCEEVSGFVGLVDQYGLKDCSFQVSSDFKEEKLSIDALVLMVAMYWLLVRRGCRVVFFDDLLRIRVGDLYRRSVAEVDEGLLSFGVEKGVARGDDYRNVVVWGAGSQAKLLIENSLFFRKAEIVYFVDSTPGKIGTRFLGRDVLSPDVLLKDEVPILIAAAQGYRTIYEELVRLGIPERRLVTGVPL